MNHHLLSNTFSLSVAVLWGQTVERHKELLSSGERASFFEDLEDLESEQYDCAGKMLVLQRIYRTQPALLAGGGAASAGASHQGELGPGMQLSR